MTVVKKAGESLSISFTPVFLPFKLKEMGSFPKNTFEYRLPFFNKDVNRITMFLEEI